MSGLKDDRVVMMLPPPLYFEVKTASLMHIASRKKERQVVFRCERSTRIAGCGMLHPSSTHRGIAEACKSKGRTLREEKVGLELGRGHFESGENCIQLHREDSLKRGRLKNGPIRRRGEESL